MRSHDERMLELMRAISVAEQRHNGSITTMRDATATPERRRSYGRNDSRSLKDVLAEFAALIEAGDAHMLSYSKRPSQMLQRYNETLAALREAEVAFAVHEEFYGGWQRYFLVVSSPGLVHDSMRC